MFCALVAATNVEHSLPWSSRTPSRLDLPRPGDFRFESIPPSAQHSFACISLSLVGSSHVTPTPGSSITVSGSPYEDVTDLLHQHGYELDAIESCAKSVSGLLDGLKVCALHLTLLSLCEQSTSVI